MSRTKKPYIAPQLFIYGTNPPDCYPSILDDWKGAMQDPDFNKSFAEAQENIGIEMRTKR